MTSPPLDLIDYARRSKEQFRLEIHGKIATATSFVAEEARDGTVHVDMEMRRDYEVPTLRGGIDPYRALPNKIHALLLSSSEFTTFSSPAAFLLLKRVGMPRKDADSPDPSSSERIGVPTKDTDSADPGPLDRSATSGRDADSLHLDSFKLAGLPKKDAASADLGSFKRVGIGFGAPEKVRSFFRHAKSGRVILL